MNPDDTNDERQARAAAKALVKMREAYEAFLNARNAEHSPRSTHLFALAMRHQGETYSRSVREVVLTLAEALPAYWPD